MSENVKKVFVLKKKIIITAAALAVVLFVVLMCIFGGKKVNTITLFYSAGENGAAVVYGDEKSSGSIPGNGVSSVKYSGKKKSAAVLMSDGSSYSLYFTDGKKNSHITSSATNNYVIAYSGAAVAYCDSASELYVFDTSKKKSTHVDDSVKYFAVTPDGESVVYSKTEEDAEKLYLYTGKKSSLIGESYTPLGVSDDLNYIYVLGGDNSLYVLDKDGNMNAKICSDVSADSFYFSADMKDIVFSDGAYTYISTEGKSRTRLVADKAKPVPQDDYNVFCDSDGLSVICKSLSETFYSADNDSGNKVFYIDKKLSSVSVSDNVKKYVLTGTDSLVYLDSQGKIYKFEDSVNSLIQSGASDMLCDAKGKHIYYMTTSRQLFCVRKGTSELISENVSKMYITNDNLLLFIKSDGSLYSASGAVISEKIDDNVYSCLCSSSAAFYMKNYSSQTGAFELYASDGSDNFNLIAENIANII